MRSSLRSNSQQVPRYPRPDAQDARDEGIGEVKKKKIATEMAKPIGRLIQKHHRQPMLSAIPPPITGPTARAMHSRAPISPV